MNVSASSVVANFGHKSLFSLDFTCKNGRFYLVCSCEPARVVAFFLPKVYVFIGIYKKKQNVSASSVIANLCVYLQFSATSLRFHWILPVQWTFLFRV